MNKAFSKIIFSLKLFIAIVSISGFSLGSAEAATLYLQPSSTNVTVGDLVTVKLFVNTQDKYINNSDGAIQFPIDTMEAVSVNFKSSIFSLWVEQPNFSNTTGLVSFNGGIPNPGYIGKSGEVMSVIFRAKKSGTASFLFNSATVRENDGLGTDILTSQIPTTINITSVAQEPIKIVTTTLNPAVISSAVYANQNSWYSDKSGILTWKLPAGSVAVQTLLDDHSNSAPSINYNPPIYQKEVKNLTDGVWYFHLRYSVADKWSEVSNYKIQIDSQSPEELVVSQTKNNDGAVSLSFSAKDNLSGIDHYDMKIDDQSPVSITVQAAKDPILLSQIKSGNHQILVTAYDKAGNKKETTIEVNIETIAPPVIVEYPQKIKVGESIVISGESIYPESKVTIVIRNLESFTASASEVGSENNYEVITNKDGKFSFVSNPIVKPGDYQIWAYVTNSNGIKSSMSTKLNTVVGQDVWAGILSKIDFVYLKQLALYIFIGLVLLLATLFGWYKYITLRKHLNLIKKREDQAFALLIKKASKQISILSRAQIGRDLTPKEEKALDELKDTINKIKSIKQYEIK